MKSERVRALLASLLLALAASAISLGVAELLVRAFAPVGLDGSKELRVPHPLLGWQGEPGGSFRYSVSENEQIVVQYNSLGLRDVEHALEKPPDARRIVVLGDSFMEAYSVRLEDSFARQLEARLHPEQPNVEVINLGVGGYGTLQEALIFRELGARYAPDLVLLGFYFDDDLRDNSWQLQQAAGAGRYLKRRSRPYVDASALPGWRVLPPDFAASQRAYRARRESFNARLARRSALIDASQRALDNARESWLGNPLRGFIEGSAAVDRVLLAEHGEHYCVEPPEFSEAWEITRAVLQRLEADVAATGARLVVFTVPSLEEVDPARARATEPTRPDAQLTCLGPRPPGYVRLATLLRELGISYVDLLPAFRAAAIQRPEQSLFHYADHHWNARGHELAARAVEWALAQRGSRAARARP